MLKCGVEVARVDSVMHPALRVDSKGCVWIYIIS